jgi:HEAT repeat protein
MDVTFDDRDRESVVRDLASSDEDVRRLAVERVGLLRLDDALPLLVERLGDSSWRVRKVAVERLVACPDSEKIAGALVAALGDGDNPGRRNAAVEALIHCGTRVVPGLLSATQNDDIDVRKLVVDALAGIADARSTDTLIGLLNDADSNVRAAAADALGAIGGEGVAEALLALGVDAAEGQLVRFSALHALGILEAPVCARDLGPVLDDPILRAVGLDLLGWQDDEEAVAVLLKGLAANSRSSRESAMRSLLRLLSRLDDAEADGLVGQIREAAAAAPQVVESAIERLPDADLSTQLVLIQFLGLLRVEQAAVPILLAGRDEALAQVALATLEDLGEMAQRAVDAAWPWLDTQARRDACVLFGSAGDGPGAARLLAALEDPEPELRIAAARSIGRCRLTEGLALLVHRLDSVASDVDFETEDEVIALTEALIAVAQPRAGDDERVTVQAIELLRSHLEGAVETARLAIAKVLGCIGRREDTQLVTFLLKDPSALVRRAAVDALARLEPGTAAEPLRLALADEAATVRIAAAVALGYSESDAVFEDLRRLAEDDDPRVRAAAVRALGHRFGRSEDEAMRGATALTLEQALADEALIALAAVEALNEIGGEAAAGRAVALVERSEPELVREAVICIGRHGDAEALDTLVPLVSHADWSVRAEAIQALADRGMVRAVPPILRRLETEQDEFVRDAILRALKRLEG